MCLRSIKLIKFVIVFMALANELVQLLAAIILAHARPCNQAAECG